MFAKKHLSLIRGVPKQLEFKRPYSTTLSVYNDERLQELVDRLPTRKILVASLVEAVWELVGDMPSSGADEIEKVLKSKSALGNQAPPDLLGSESARIIRDTLEYVRYRNEKPPYEKTYSILRCCELNSSAWNSGYLHGNLARGLWLILREGKDYESDIRAYFNTCPFCDFGYPKPQEIELATDEIDSDLKDSYHQQINEIRRRFAPYI